jgi:peroxiredoxin
VVSADSEAELRALRTDLALDFTLLSDPEARVITLYGLAHPEGGPEGQTIAIPSEILVRSDGTIAWQHVAGRIQERPTPRAILAEIERL